MKKSIFYVAIAVLLLVGFTACQQPMTYKVPTALVATAPNKDYIVDETFDPSTVDLTVIYSDGSSDKLNGSQVIVAPATSGADSSKIKADGSTFIFKYGPANSTVETSVTVYGYKVVKADLGNLPTVATWTGADTSYTAEFAKGAVEAITVNATLENGATRTLSQATDEVDVEVTSITAAANTKADKAFVATVKAFGDTTGVTGANVTYDGKASYTVSVSAKTEDFDETENYDLVYKLTVGDNEEFDSSSDTAYLEQSYSWALYLQNDNGATKPVALNEVYVLNYQNAPSQTGKIGREAVEYEVRLVSDKTKTCIVEIPAGENYITDIKYNKKYVEEYVLTVGKAVKGADIDLEPLYAVEFDDTLDVAIEWDADENVAFIDSDTPVADTKFAPQIQIKWTGLDGKEFTKVIKLEAETPAAK